jgi:cytochrome P450
MRSLLSPWLSSSSKLKSKIPIFNLCIQNIIQKIDKFAKNSEEFNIYEMLEEFTMETIDKSAFSIEKNNKNFLMDATRGVFSVKTSQFLASLLLCFPEFSLIINVIRDISEAISDYFELTSHGLLWKWAKTIVSNRNKNKNFKTNRKDMLDLMIDLRDEEDRNVIKRSKKSLSNTEIIANTVVIHEAAYESPANGLAFIIHNIINNPDIQEKMIEEVDTFYDEETDFSFNVMSKLPLTEAVIKETFRLYPTDTLFTSRTSNIDYKFESFLIPRGVDVRIPTFQLHRDEEFWPEPEKFDPYRFVSIENFKAIDPVIYQPFGAGPRICPGQNFAFLEMKLVLAHILHKYRLVPGPNTEIGDIELNFKLITLSPKNGVFVKVVPRDSSQD